MKVSVIVPVYNVEKYIDKCLNSLVNQTLKDIEIIVVNDGTLDNSQKIIDRYLKKYPKIIKSFIKENGGLGSARNYGLEKATGEYIAFVDSDDFIELDMLDKMYNKAKSDNSDVVICGVNVIKNNTKIKESQVKFKDDKLNILFGDVAVWNKLYKRSIIDRNNIKFRCKVWYEDIDFTSKILFDDIKISFMDDAFYNYLLRQGSIMNNSNVEKNLDLIYSFDEIIRYFKEKNLYEKNYEEIEFLCIYHMYICAISRVINAKSSLKNKKIVINKFIKYVKNNFSDFKDNKYLKYLGKNKKIIYKLINLRLYFMIKIIFKLKEKIQQ